MKIDQLAPLAQTTRGGEIETLHLGALVVVDGTGRLLASTGDPGLRLHLRSTAKPFQLLPLLLDGLHQRSLPGPEGPWRLEEADLAVMTASHSGQPMHLARVRRALELSGLDEAHLQCGAHPPVWRGAAEALIRSSALPTPLHNNCSGKHVGMLLTCRERGWPLHTYLHPDHPLQQRILALVAALSRVEAAEIGLGTDGCSAPTFILPLEALARLFAALAAPEHAPAVEGGSAADALGAIFRAGTRHPDLVAGSERIDTTLMRALPGQLFSKIGAQGAHALAVAPSPRHPHGLGIALKVADGDEAGRLRPALLVGLLRELGVLGDALPPALEAALDPHLRNVRGLPVGEILAASPLLRFTSDEAADGPDHV